MQGTIQSFVAEKQFGFIKGDDGKDYFFHQDAFSDERHRRMICDDTLVQFEPIATPKGYKAQKCRIVDPVDVPTFVVPDDIPTSKSGEIRSWEIIELGNWIIHGSSRDSPDAARNDMLIRAGRLGATAVLNVEYYKTTGSEAGTGRGTHHFTIHNFRGRLATVGRRSAKGRYRADDLRGLNERAAKQWWEIEADVERKKRKNAIMWSIIAGVCVLAGVLFAFFDFSGVGLLILVIISIAVGIGRMENTDDDRWLARG